ncbi:phosphatidylinositol 3-kinase regulatory subunit alpha isoform X3 [Dendroctonus ponderosae]|uniref:Phosphatidylinositol 3-kinase regulatory subunit alpha n=1 Tax=Dendroctonus ponderosae TaxID=77166 RepID=A0AAR5PVT1_DENPD|nr:phosphatidylinositol 3-kinase regulatory subunit alpha isoform X3 [Dendroctonus ponderosae]
MGDFAYIYQALQSFEPIQNNGVYLAIQRGDTFEISASSPYGHLKNPNLLFAYNRRTGASGYVRVEHVKLLGQEVNKKIHHPSEIGVPEPEKKPSAHKLEGIYVLTPILCKHCNDYIWGQGLIGVKCKDCHACYHNYCARFFVHYLCRKDSSELPPATLDYDKPICEWLSSHVVEWMAAINLHPYTELFKCKDVKGGDLAHLDREKLLAMGIKDEFHQAAMLAAIAELLNKIEDRQTELSEAPESNNAPAQGFPHSLLQHSFSSLKKCDKCNKYLRGLFHQGFICTTCGLVAHRTCVATGLVSCSGKPLDEGRNSFLQFRSYFGQGLCVQFKCSPTTPAPLLLVKCVKALEAIAKDNTSLELYNIYSATPPADQVNKLVKIIDSDINSLDLSSASAVTIAGLIKKYLRELPDPLIPVQWYDRFLEAQKRKSDEECTSVLKQLLEQLPEHHMSTLHFIMAHLCRICQMEFARGNKNPPAVLTQVMCHIFMRPPWDRIIQVVYNTQAHNRIIEILLMHCDWGEVVPEFASAPAIPPRKVSGRMGTSLPIRVSESSSHSEKEKKMELQDAEWYWGDIKREVVNELLNNTVDGTFLVRDASSKGGEYTLTLRKGGANKLIKICHSKGKYGFTEPYKYNSVVDLINHFRNVSLSQYNTSLNIKLQFPVNRNNQEEEQAILERTDKLKTKLEQIHKSLVEKQKECERVSKDFNETCQDVQTRRLSLNAFRELVRVFEKQTLIQEKFQNEAQPHEIKTLEVNAKLLKQRLGLMIDSCEQLEKNLQSRQAYNRSLERELNSLKPEIQNLRREREQFIRWLLQRGVKQTEINNLINWNEDDTIAEVETDVDSMPHNEQASWFMPDSTREQAEDLLSGKPDGTFLIRKSSNKPNFVLVVNCNGTPNHCIIHQTEKGFGFSEPYNIYPTLLELVLHYATNSLEIHNDLLTTVLKHPVGSINASPSGEGT